MISTITMVCSIITINITKNRVALPVNRLREMLETSKYHLYMKYFYNEERRNPKSDLFKEAVKEAYSEIKILIPDLSQNGFMQEDWLMAEWLMKRKLTRMPKDAEIKPLSEYISKIRENKL